MNYKEISNTLLRIVQNAGSEIMKIYLDPNLSERIEIKEDNSPLTLADKRSNKVIIEDLAKDYDFPILSEESAMIDFSQRKDWNKFWLVDPLDGTKEFINKNGEFTVNIALIENEIPTLGIIGVPAKQTYYVGYDDNAWKIESGEVQKITVNKKYENRIAVRSRTHASIEEEAVLKEFDVHDSISVGSSLKFCMVAEGQADVYFRYGPTMEWDIAAGHAIVKAAGGGVFIGSKNEIPFNYNKENLKNGSFLCTGF